MKIAIIGLGYVGLPLAMVFADAGIEVVGVEAVPERCATVNDGRSYIQDVPDADLKRVVRRRTHFTRPRTTPPSRTATPSSSAFRRP